MRITRYVFLVFFLINIIFGSYIALTHLNFLQIDLAGHIWSSVQFGRGFYHAFSDQIFLGYTHGLFYPPLEDAILATITKVSRENPFLLYPFYLSVLIAFYFFSLWRLLRHLTSSLAFVFLGTVFLFLSNIEKVDMLKLQGLSLIDLFVTGLSSETLAFCFFLLLIELVLFAKSCSQRKITLLLTLTILSHIVIGIVAILWMATNSVTGDNKFKLRKSILLSLGLSTFYWMPVVFHKSYIANSVIFHYSPWVELAIAGLSLAVAFWQKNIRAICTLLICLMLFTATTIVPFYSFLTQLVPKFHYYRFVIIGYFLLAIGLALLLEEIKWDDKNINHNRRKVFATLGLSLSFCFFLINQFNLQPYNLNWVSFEKTNVDLRQVGNLSLDGYGRYLVFGDDRAPDTGIDSILAANFKDFRSTKGLFWESSRTNTLQSSFLATLLTPPVVLDHYYFKHLNCEEQKCMLDQMFRYYNVKGVIGNPYGLSYLIKEKAVCYQDIFKNGTNLFRFNMTGVVRVSNQTYPIFKTVYKDKKMKPAGFSVEPVEYLSADGVRLLEKQRITPQSLALDESYKYCSGDLNSKSSLQLIAREEDWPEISRLLPPQEIPLDQENNTDQFLSFTKISEHEFKFKAPSDRERFYVFKLSPQPGASAYAADGSKIPLFETFPYLLVYGLGDITLKFNKTNGMYFGYLFSMISLIVFVFIQTNHNKSTK